MRFAAPSSGSRSGSSRFEDVRPPAFRLDGRSERIEPLLGLRGACLLVRVDFRVGCFLGMWHSVSGRGCYHVGDTVVTAARCSILLATRHRLLAAAVACAALSAIAIGAQAPEPAQRFDLLITNARVFDSTGNPAFQADVGVRDGHIVALGRLGNAEADRRIDATGKFVSPGFIDIHSHAVDGARSRGLGALPGKS